MLRPQGLTLEIDFQFLFGGIFTFSTKLINSKFCVWLEKTCSSIAQYKQPTYSIHRNDIEMKLTLKWNSDEGLTLKIYLPKQLS